MTKGRGDPGTRRRLDWRGSRRRWPSPDARRYVNALPQVVVPFPSGLRLVEPDAHLWREPVLTAMLVQGSLDANRALRGRLGRVEGDEEPVPQNG
jgi:hypothetical protein